MYLMIRNVSQVSDLATGPFVFFISQICTFPWLFWFGGVFFFVVADTCAELDLWFKSSISCTVSFTAFMTFVSTPHQEQSRGRYTSLSMYPFNSYSISITQDYFILWILKWYVWCHNHSSYIPLHRAMVKIFDIYWNVINQSNFWINIIFIC